VIEGLLTLPVVLPVLFWAAYHYHKDRHLPEPVGHLVLAFALGIGANYLSREMYGALDLLGWRFDATQLGAERPWALLAYAVFAIGPIEEFAKLAVFLLVPLHFREFDEPIDGIIYASFIGLGYAAAENVHYLQFLTTGEAFARGFASPVIHILFASIWGHRIAMARMEGRSLFVPALAGFAIAACLHGVYDFIVLLKPVRALPIAAMLILAIWYWRLKLMHALHLDAIEASRSDSKRNGSV